MTTETIGRIVSILSPGLIVIGTYLLVPKRRLLVSERVGIYIIFWGFMTYAMWLAYTEPGSYFIKNFSLVILFFYGLIITLACQLAVEPPILDIKDAKLRKITIKTWKRLPRNVKIKLQGGITRIREIPQWDSFTKQVLTQLSVKRNPAKYQQGDEIQISKIDCTGLSDEVISGSLAHEFGHAYQAMLTPNDIEAIEKAGDELPATKWGFGKEIEAANEKLESENISSP